MINFVTLDTLIKDLLFIIRGSKISQSETISWYQVEYWIHQYRGLLIKQDIDKNKMPNPDYIQEIPSVKLTKVDKVGPYSNIASKEYVYRTDIQIPKTIDFNFKSGLLFIGTLDGQEIQLIPQSRTEWKKYKKYGNRETTAYLRNGYIYIDSVNALSHIAIRGIFEIPTEVSNLINSINTLPEYTTDVKYPIPINMIPILKEMILKKELNIMTNVTSDDKNDSQLKTEPNQQKDV